MRNRLALSAVYASACILLAISGGLPAQTAPPPPNTTPATPQADPARRGPAARRPAFPEHPPADPAALERGRAVYGVNCNFCHGSDARGGEGGPNLLRSELVLNDMNGEGITGVIRNGRIDQGMPKFDLTQAQISDIAAFLHNFKVGGYDVTRNAPPTIVIGDAKAGMAYFATTCSKCHSTTGDLKAIGSKYADAKQLQQRWLMPNSRGGGGGFNAYPITATVTPSKGKKTEGRLVRIDDFLVTVTDADSIQRTFERNGEEPKVEIHDPLDPHKQLLRTYTDSDIHNLTAFLVTVK